MNLRSLSLLIAALGVALLIAGFAFGSDLLGFFMVCIVVVIVLFVAGLVRQRRQAA